MIAYPELPKSDQVLTAAMSMVLEIEKALEALPITDARKVADWLQQYLDEKWDQRIDNDIANGRLENWPITLSKTSTLGGQSLWMKSLTNPDFWRAYALAVSIPGGYLWFWIGTHDQYEQLLKDS